MIKRHSFLKAHEKRTAALEETIRLYRRAPGPEQVHHLRTAVRRFDRSSTLLPASLRKEKKLKEYRTTTKELAKLNNRIRDIDIIAASLHSSFGEDEAGVLPPILGRLRAERAMLQPPALRVASRLRPAAPQVDAEKVRGGKLRKRYRKVVCETLESLEADFRTVTAGRDVGREPLHALRMRTKELRYTLELGADGSADDLDERLQSWQDQTGRILDIDTTTEYLRGLDISSRVEEFIETMRAKRRRLFLGFLDSSHRSKTHDLLVRLRRDLRDE